MFRIRNLSTMMISLISLFITIAVSFLFVYFEFKYITKLVDHWMIEVITFYFVVFTTLHILPKNNQSNVLVTEKEIFWSKIVTLLSLLLLFIWCGFLFVLIIIGSFFDAVV